MLQECIFNPETDFQAVEQTGFVDLAKANAMNSLPASLQASELSFNEIEDPNSIGARPSDVFEAGQMGRAIEARVPKKSSE